MPRAPKSTTVAAKYKAVAASKLVPSPARLFTGTSGWAYPSWKPGFYPAEVPTRAFLHAYAARLTSVEVNYTFRTLCEEEQLRGWLAATPPGFRFSFKAPQQITHFQRLRESHDALAGFFASLALAREAGKLGAVLFQLPPNFKVDLARLTDMLASPSLAGGGWQLAFEFRHESWFAEPVYDLLRSHDVALCIAESEDLVTPEMHTAKHVYYRLRCPGGYARTKLKAHAAKFAELALDREVYAYYKHEDAPTGALNAVAMLRAATAAANAATTAAASAARAAAAGKAA